MGDEVLLKEIGARIAARRKEMSLTQEKLAEIMDVSVQMISNLEKGKKAIRPENLVKLCAALKVSADWVLREIVAASELDAFAEKFRSLSAEDRHLVDALMERLLADAR